MVLLADFNSSTSTYALEFKGTSTCITVMREIFCCAKNHTVQKFELYSITY